VHEAHKNPIYGSVKRRWLERRWAQELVGSGPPAIVAGVGAYNARHLNAVSALALLLGCLWLVVSQLLKVFQAFVTDRREDEARGHEGLIAGLHVLRAIVCHTWTQSAVGDIDLRVTFHRVVPPVGDAAEHVEQIVPYVGKANGGLGRKFSIRFGITGQACRTGRVFVLVREDASEDAYRQELVKECGFTRGDVKTITLGRYAAMAVPIVGADGHRVLGVVYLDSSEKRCFDSAAMRRTILEACMGINNYVETRYV